LEPVPIRFRDYIGDFGGSLITIHLAGEDAFVFRAAVEHFLAQMLSFERSGLNALDVAFKGGFEGCGRQMANRRVPLHFSEAADNLVGHRFGIRRERHGNHEGSGEGSHLHSLFTICRQVDLGGIAPAPGFGSVRWENQNASQAASARVW
jgi:hypothetical protein